MAHAGFPNGLDVSLESVEKQIENYNETFQVLFIAVDNLPIGEVNYRLLENNVGSFGIKICEQNQLEKGIGTKALVALIAHLFDNLRCEKVIVDTSLENKRATHVYMNKLGFVRADNEVNTWVDPQGHTHKFWNLEMKKELFEKLYSK